MKPMITIGYLLFRARIFHGCISANCIYSDDSFAFGVRFSFKQGDQIAILGDAEDAVMHNAMNGARRCAPLEVLAALGAQV